MENSQFSLFVHITKFFVFTVSFSFASQDTQEASYRRGRLDGGRKLHELGLEPLLPHPYVLPRPQDVLEVTIADLGRCVRPQRRRGGAEGLEQGHVGETELLGAVLVEEEVGEHEQEVASLGAGLRALASLLGEREAEGGLLPRLVFRVERLGEDEVLEGGLLGGEVAGAEVVEEAGGPGPGAEEGLRVEVGRGR